MKNNLSDSDYENIFNSIEKFTKGSLHLFALKNIGIKEIIRNFIAKSFSFLNSIFILQQSRQFGESAILYRTLVERFVYLKYIIENKLYVEFDDWSFIKDFEARNNFRSYPAFFDGNIKKSFLKDEKTQIDRYERLKKEKPKWIEPNIETYLKKIDLGFLYKLSYDLGSSYVHPRASEGHIDVMRLTELKNENEWIFNPILHNSILINVAILQVGLLNIELCNKLSVHNYCNKMFKYLSCEVQIQDLDTLTKICTIGLIG